jgi:phosphate/phosphite/phosphonate ABC transporter binding protein
MATEPKSFSRTRLGRFELVSRLATGGMAEIFLASERGVHGLERLVVIKRILPHLAEHESFREMFLQEARFVARLSHPNIVQIYELGDIDDTTFIAMEYVPGASFRDLMRRAAKQSTPFPIAVAVGLVAAGCAGAHAAHELTDAQGQPLGLVHRDISPHNLMVTGLGHVKLLDFGIAKATEIALENTRTGALKGKLHYMSPEQVRQEPLDRRSDVFSLGIVLWELLTARRLFKRDSELMTMQAIINGELWDPREYRKDVPAAIAAVVMRSLAVDRDERYASADIFRRALEDAALAEGLRVGPDVVAGFVERTIGDELRRTEKEVKEALEHAREIPLDDDERTVLDRKGGPAANEDTGSRTGAHSETLPQPSIPPRLLVVAPIAKKSVVGVFAAVAVLTFLVASAVLFVVLRRGPPVEGPEIRIGWAPTIDPKVLAADIEPLRVYLERQTGRPFRFVFADSYDDLAKRLVDGEVQFAAMPPMLFVKTEIRDPRVHPIALKLIGGSSGSDGVLLTSEDSGITTVAELRGKRICIPDQSSTTGVLFPKLALKKAGIDWSKDITIVNSGNHLQVMRDIKDRKCDAGGTYSGAFISAVTQGVNPASLRQLAITGRAPQDTIAAAPLVDKGDLDLVTRALFAFNPQAETGKPVLGSIEMVTGFGPVKTEDYADLRELVRTMDSP